MTRREVNPDGANAVKWQGTCVAIGARGVMIEGAPGIGKSSLALALIDRGARLVADDVVLLRFENGALLASLTASRALAPVSSLARISPSSMRPEPKGLPFKNTLGTAMISRDATSP